MTTTYRNLTARAVVVPDGTSSQRTLPPSTHPARIVPLGGEPCSCGTCLVRAWKVLNLPPRQKGVTLIVDLAVAFLLANKRWDLTWMSDDNVLVAVDQSRTVYARAES